MKEIFRFLLVVAIISSCSKNNGNNGGPAAQVLPDTLSAGWSKIRSLPIENFTDIFFSDNNNGYAVGDNGIYKSIDAGDSWTKINTATGFLSIGAANNGKAAFLNGSPNLFVTQDGGSSFTNPAYSNPGGGNPGFFDCVFTTADTCFFSSNQLIWKSVNGGTVVDTIFKFTNPSSSSSLFFLNSRQGWIVRLDGVYNTVDGGDSWTIDTALVNGYGSVYFTDANNGYFSNYGTISKTTDGGLTWTSVFQSPFQVFGDIRFISTAEGYVSIGKKIYKTSDGGNNWTTVVTLGNQFIGKIFFTDQNHGWACTSDGTLIRYAP